MIPRSEWDFPRSELKKPCCDCCPRKVQLQNCNWKQSQWRKNGLELPASWQDTSKTQTCFHMWWKNVKYALHIFAVYGSNLYDAAYSMQEDRGLNHSTERWVLWQSSHFQDLEAFWRMTCRYLMLIQSFLLELSENVRYWLGWISFWDSLGFNTWQSCAPKHRHRAGIQKSGPLAFLHSLPSMEASQKWAMILITCHSHPVSQFRFSCFQASR